jgi:hypothetical protein
MRGRQVGWSGKDLGPEVEGNGGDRAVKKKAMQ